MKLVDCDRRHAAAILAIFNDAIRHSTALYEYREMTPALVEAWFAGKARGRYPILGFEDEDGTLAGFASYGPFRARAAYKYTVEHSVYVEARHRGRGLGRRLMEALIARAQAQDYHAMIGAVDASNAASVALHRSLGFEHCGTLRQVGFKFGRWLDLDFYQLILPTPSHPTEAEPA